MIYLTGDTHGGIDVKKLLDPKVAEKIGKDDYLIICGDFGFIWNNGHESAKEKNWLDWFDDQPWTTLFVDGNHENFERLNEYPDTAWNGGAVHVIRPKLLHLMRGQVYEIDGKKIFTMGGASSHDRGPAKGQKTCKGWWPEELPDRSDYQTAGANLQKYNYKVDYIVTHCLPTSLQSEVTKGKFHPDGLTQYLQSIYQSVSYEHWYCGHYHVDRDIGQNVTILYNRIVHAGGMVASSKPMRGQPRYNRGEEVRFLYQGEEVQGKIAVVFAFGSFRQKEQPSYNISFTNGKAGMAIQVVESDIIGSI